MTTFAKVYQVVAQIPKGKVMTYGQVSQLSGVNNPRVVGYALASNKDPKNIPCHRVIKSDRTLAGYAFGGWAKKKEILEKEGVIFINNVVSKVSLVS